MIQEQELPAEMAISCSSALNGQDTVQLTACGWLGDPLALLSSVSTFMCVCVVMPMAIVRFPVPMTVVALTVISFGPFFSDDGHARVWELGMHNEARLRQNCIR